MEVVMRWIGGVVEELEWRSVLPRASQEVEVD